MSSLKEKLAKPEMLPGTRARRSLASLRCCRGYRVLAGTESSPERVAIQPMDTVSAWARVPGLRGTFEQVPNTTGPGEE
ncbi:hypothetical protein [Hyalangium versicolor]|uniref:hypothetical protein n=1 Tax=Hyalangium versicolor TaxID=2861190 RepID=UPI001CCABE27|nr:hypothetical protein [Hyalangium versicolor]